MIVYSKMSLHAFGSGSTSYSTMWKNNIKNHRFTTNSNNLVMNPNTSSLKDADNIGTIQARIANIVSLYINNKIYIDLLNGANRNGPSWALLPIPPRLIQTMHLYKFRKNKLERFMYAQLDY